MTAPITVHGRIVIIDGSFDDWYCITDERGRRIGGADIEGTREEMLAIADGIEKREAVSFKRCRVAPSAVGFTLDSPRNSVRATFVSDSQAVRLALDIRAKFATSARAPVDPDVESSVSGDQLKWLRHACEQGGATFASIESDTAILDLVDEIERLRKPTLRCSWCSSVVESLDAAREHTQRCEHNPLAKLAVELRAVLANAAGFLSVVAPVLGMQRDDALAVATACRDAYRRELP